MTVTITSFALLPGSLKGAVRDMGGEVTHTERWWDDDGVHDIEIEVYFDTWLDELEQEIESIIEDTEWTVNWLYDYENNGVCFEWCQYA